MQKLIKRLWYIFRQRYGQILLLLLLLTISIVSFKSGKFLLSNDNYSPELNPWMSVQRYVESPAWRGYRVLGVPSDSEQADIFRSIIFLLVKPLVGVSSIGQIYYLVSLVAGTILMATLVSSLVRDSKIRRYSQVAYLFSGIVYMTTLWSMWLFYQVMAPYITNFAVFPLLLLVTYRTMKNPSLGNIFLVFLSSILFSSVSVIATLFIVDSAVLFLFLIVIGLSLKRTFWSVIGRIAKIFSVFLAAQLFWILPFIHYTVTNSQNVLDSYVNKTITTSTIDLESEMETPMNAARLYNRNILEMEDDAYVFPLGSEFQTYDFYKVVGFLPAFLSILAIIFGIFKKHKKLLFWGGLALGSWFLIKAVNPPFEFVFVWLQENIPLFKQVLRWPYSKLGQIYLVAITVLSTFGLIYLTSFLSAFFKKGKVRNVFRVILFTLFLLLPLFYAEYMFRGDIFSKRSLVDYPDDYVKLNQYIAESDLQGRIYYAPPSNNNYFRKNDWGFWGSQFISYVIPNPVMDLSSAVGSRLGEEAMLDLSNAFRAGNRDRFDSLLKKYEVEYVLFDKSINLEGFSFDLDSERSISMLDRHPIVWDSEILTLHKVQNNANGKYVEALGVHRSKTDYFSKEYPNLPQLHLSDLELQNLRLDKNELVGEYLHLGGGAFWKNNLRLEELDNLPTKLLLKGNQITATPSLSHIQGDDSRLPTKTFDSLGADYYVFQNNVYTRNQVSDGITIEQRYRDVESVYVPTQLFKTVDYIPSMLRSVGSDCSGNTIVNNTNVAGEKMAMGFRLKGSSELPCVYSRVHDLEYHLNYVMKINLNWEVSEGNYPGFCVFSDKEQRCLNREKFFDSNNGFGNQEQLIEYVVSGSDKISLILYAININNEVSSEVNFKKVELSFTPITDVLSKTSESKEYKAEEVFLNYGQKYLMSTPLVYGDSLYNYDHKVKKDLLWQPIKDGLDSQSIYEISSSGGMHQKAQKQIVNQSIDLFKTETNARYKVFWNGENISNIPSSLCFIYDEESKCWFQEMLSVDVEKAETRFFESDLEPKLITLVYGSTSYKLPTENVLKNLLVMKYPREWDNITYIPTNEKKYTELKANSIFKSPHSTYYRVEIDSKYEGRNLLVSIPQASNSGWLAVGRIREGSIKFFDKESRLSVNGWKQGWDVSGTDYESITVLYWPNLLSYFGYAVIFVLLLYIPIKISKQRKYDLY